MMSERNFMRPAYEAFSAFAFLLLAAVTALGLMGRVAVPGILEAIFCASLAFGVVRLNQAVKVWRFRIALDGQPAEVISSKEVVAKMQGKPDHVWLGKGFVWTRVHAQRLYDLEKLDLKKLRVPGREWWKRFTAWPGPSKGSPYIHGVEPQECDIYVPLSQMKGNLFVPATTGSIKTRLLALLAVQAIHRTPRETVIVVDPKGDQELRELLRAEACAAGRAQDFAYFHPASPRESVRLDLLANWTRATEVASRIGALKQGEPGSDPWSAFEWRVLNVVTEGYVATHRERPTLATLRRYVEGGIDELLHNTLVYCFEQEGIDWRSAAQQYMGQATKLSRPGPAVNLETVALAIYYKAECQQASRIRPVDGLISMWEHNREHAQKMLAGLVPILTMLTAGDLAELLSPDHEDPDDRRPILNGASIAESGTVFYLGADALSDAVVGAAICSIFIADLTAYAGARYNLGITLPIVNLFNDEANESINVPTIQLLNKGRQAGFMTTMLSQTFPDFVAKLGSEALARQVLGNCNSIIVGRTKDSVTAEYVMENFGETVIASTETRQGTNTVVDGELLNYSGSYSHNRAETVQQIVKQETLGRLPDLEYFASFSGSPIYKGRIPVVRSG